MTKEKLLKMTVSELRKACKERGLSRYAHAKKADLINMLFSTDLGDTPKNEPNWEAKKKYIDKAEKDMIIAFKIDSDDSKIKSAKIVRKSSKEKVFKCVTSYGKEFLVKYNDVIWVKTGSRWPRGVYNLLKGVKEDE